MRIGTITEIIVSRTGSYSSEGFHGPIQFNFTIDISSGLIKILKLVINPPKQAESGN
jgi:hypothetical protein